MASTEPLESAAPKSSRRSSVVSRRETRFLTARVATAACRRGPKAPGGTPASSATRDAVPDREGGDRRLEARAEGSRRHSGEQRGARRGAALRAAQALQAMLAEDDRRRRQLRDLMARGRPERRALRGAEHVAAAAAGGPVVEKLVERLDRRQM